MARIGEGRWQELGVLYAEDVVVINPFVTALRAEDVVIHETTDPEVAVAEFRNVGTAADGSDFERPVLFILRVRNGVIIESRDYMGPRRSLPGSR